ncbi:MAG: YraN family protein [Pararhodobacter sp.]|nr:YraN family protein [Pararhodobacter sp.]
MKGKTAWLSGTAAESQVARRYADGGAAILARRWRGAGGEIDIIARAGDTTVFVEVKQSRNHADAAQRLTRHQILRLFDAAAEYMGQLPNGLNSNARFDVALVDRVGQITIVENALCA